MLAELTLGCEGLREMKTKFDSTHITRVNGFAEVPVTRSRHIGKNSHTAEWKTLLLTLLEIMKMFWFSYPRLLKDKEGRIDLTKDDFGAILSATK